jgi:hypothetical protein
VDNSKRKDQKPLTRASFAFSAQEADEAIRRDIHIQLCFNKFWEWLERIGRSSFKRSEWETWFSKERNGKDAKAALAPDKNAHYERMMVEHNNFKGEERTGMSPEVRKEFDRVRAQLKRQRTH